MSVQERTTLSAPDETAHPDRGITLRSIIIGFIATIPGVFWGVYGDVVSQTDLTSTSLMMPPILILITLLVINTLLRRRKPQWVLSPTEMITIYVMNTMAVILSGMGMLQFLCTTLGAVPHYGATQPWIAGYLDLCADDDTPEALGDRGFLQGK